MKELETVKAFEDFLEAGDSWNNVAVQGLNLEKYSKQLLDCDFAGSVFLGCALEKDVVLKMISSGGLHFPRIENLPFKPFRPALYSRDTLYDNFDPKIPDSYVKTTDWRIYRHYLETGGSDPDTILESLARRLHDFSITDALNDYFQQQGDNSLHNHARIVAIMGGHGLARNAPDYKKVAQIARSLSQSGYLVISGGGPGAMEATHLGAWFAGYNEKELDKAIELLSHVPVFKEELRVKWLSKAFEVIKKFPEKKYKNTLTASVGIPTWLYGHEPPTPFAARIAKYFANSVREEGLLAVAKGGVIFAPGSAGTIQEIFQDACQNHYKSYRVVSPMVFLNEGYWKWNKPVYPLLAHLAAGKEYAGLLTISDDTDFIIKTITGFTASQ
ncbi:MAG: hypothetical protein GY757_57490 [bacterium]|nr:hypothetical protein [bacterium]